MLVRAGPDLCAGEVSEYAIRTPGIAIKSLKRKTPLHL